METGLQSSLSDSASSAVKGRSEKGTRYREISVGGAPREMGRQIGEAAREEIKGFCQIALDRVNLTMAVSRERALQTANSCIRYIREYSPHLLAEVEGMAEASGVFLEELILLQIRNQLTPDPEAGCTAVSIAANDSATGRTMVAQNWDNDPELDPFTVILTRRPIGKPALLNVTQAGLIAYIGLNDTGLGICMNTLPAPRRELGVPHYFTVRGIYEASSLEEAVQAVRRAHRAIPANILLATPQGPADLEITISDIHVLRDNGSGAVVHTNHCLHPDLSPINGQFPELIQSVPRKARIEKLLYARNRPYALQALKTALADHEHFPRSICRHTNEDAETGFWATVFSVIIDPEERRMHISRGNPCSCAYESYHLN